MTSRLPVSLSSTLVRGSRGTEVQLVQELLNLSSSRPRLVADGDFGQLTEQSVRFFQSGHALTIDGKVGPRTYTALERAARLETTHLSPQPQTPQSPATQTPTNTTGTATASGFSFPLAYRPSPTWKTGGRYFGASRDHGNRLHAGCDLLGPRGTTIYAIADGVLVQPEYGFYLGTNAVELQHGTFLVRYGEILPGSYIGGQRVHRGQPIAKIGRLSTGSSMLHFEMYSNGNNHSTLTGGGAYHRRSDLINPSPYLDEWIDHLPG
ncbi:MAG: peptidoglycan DD-metalloendopeptidase family protein [Polyangiaceae bacterium]